ncbi:site-specific integrase [Virgibacillus sp. C22-A2]|uniref:Site-specific integrase n=1 Tax=Virgibacillus tibetensis TaxID=3042313 RepID=A0ABU6KA97_9BACI|nr:site-specific integrase [Virgibacillus sp. C22-A2]
MSSFSDIGKGKYKLFVELGYDNKGKRIRKTKTVNASGVREAQRKLSEFETEVYSKTHIDTKETPFSAFVELWKTNYGYSKIERRTLENYENSLASSIIPYFGSMKMNKIKTLHIVEFFRKEEEAGRATLEMKYFILSNIFRHAKLWGIIETNPMEGIEKPKYKKNERDPYNDKEIETLLERIKMQPTQHQLIIKLAVLGALRRGEVIGLTDDVIDFENNQITVKQTIQYTKRDGLYMKGTKKEDTRTITIPEFLMRELEDYYKERLEFKEKMANLWEGFKDQDGNKLFMLFSNEYGKPYTPNAVTRFWHRFLDRTDLRRIAFHDLRHSAVSYALRHGVNIKVIQKRLGHKNITTTLNTYAHVTDDDDKEVSDILNNMFGHQDDTKTK